MKKTILTADNAVDMLVEVHNEGTKNLYMPGDPRYQPKGLKPFLGYDQWARWLIIVEWFWMKTLAIIGVMPKGDAALMKPELLKLLLLKITTTQQDEQEYGDETKGLKGTKHDILALLILMRQYLPPKLHRWLHYCATSYDIICTAYSLQLLMTVKRVIAPELSSLDEKWRNLISENAGVLQMGRTHLQQALPVTAGFWLANLHNRANESSRKVIMAANKVCVKFSGATGTSASQRALIKSRQGEKILAEMLGLPVAKISTQITPPESMARFYFELTLLSGSLANLGEDTRILQSPWFGEVTSHSSTSSAMSHKAGNPITAENICGLHVNVVAEFSKVTMTLVSDFQRDLRWSSVMRSFPAIMVYTFQQILNTTRLIGSMKIDSARCLESLKEYGNLSPAETLHLSLQGEGLPNAHEFVNKKIVPFAKEKKLNLFEAMESYVKTAGNRELVRIWRRLKKGEMVKFLVAPEIFIGNSIEIARRELENKL